MEDDYSDEKIMDEEIKEYYEDYFQHREGKLEGSCQDIQENFQQTVALPLDGNEIDQHLDVEIHVNLPKFDEDIHILNDQDKDKDSYSNLSLDHLFSEILFQNEVCQNHIFEVAYMETQSNKSTYILEFQENNTLVYGTFQTQSHEGNKGDDRIQAQQNDNHELQENIEKAVVELHHFEHEYVIHQNTSLEITNSELFYC